MKHLVAAGAIALASPVVAQPQCIGYPDLAAVLTTELSQSLAARGIIVYPGPGFTEAWVNGETGQWTIVVVLPGGLACIVAFGNDWQTYPPGQPS